MKFIDNMLEFREIKNQLMGYAVTERAKQKFDELSLLLNERELRVQMNETSEARKLMDMNGTPPFSAIKDIKKLIEATERGEMLSIAELEQIRMFATLCMRIKRYLQRSTEMNFSISTYGSGMMELDLLKEEIERCIRGERIDDYASKELKEIRRKIEIMHTQVRTKLESLLKTKKEYFSESFVSNRNGHFTLPVKKEYKFQVSGSVIDVSSSGATYFIEPSSVAKLKEELTEFEIAQNNEERKILYMLSSCVNDFKTEILLNLEYIEELDFIFSKAKLSAQINGIEPNINTERKLVIKNGRHPFIRSESCIPLTIEFLEYRGIIITGPNTGGKTVALKTIGLFSVMAQCGLHVPCEMADICMNSQILCDIGDGQSITENLSTFSAHMKNVIDIIKQVKKDSLILLDELGSGTDPTEGMGIAIAILEELKQSGCNFMATTHYPEIKEYAQHKDGITNARMAFDKESLKPLYRLEMGMAGESCALYIAKRLGMPEHMLKRAYEETKRKVVNKTVLDIEEELYNQKGEKQLRNEGNLSIPQLQKMIPEKQISQKALKFQIGDSVMVYPEKSIGIVFQRTNGKGEIGVQIHKKKVFINHKRLKLKAEAKELYPENYDFSIIFESVTDRKARHQMSRKHVPELMIYSEEKNSK